MVKLLFFMTAFTFSFNAYSLDVGDTAPCVVLDAFTPDGGEETKCIRDRDDSQKYTVIDFFSVFCGACVANLPNLKKLHDAVKSTTQVRLVSIDRDEDDLKDFLKERRTKKYVKFPVAHDPYRDAKKEYKIRATPTLFVLDENNEVVMKHVGMLDDDYINKIKKKVLKED